MGRFPPFGYDVAVLRLGMTLMGEGVSTQSCHSEGAVEWRPRNLLRFIEFLGDNIGRFPPFGYDVAVMRLGMTEWGEEALAR